MSRFLFEVSLSGTQCSRFFLLNFVIVVKLSKILEFLACVDRFSAMFHRDLIRRNIFCYFITKESSKKSVPFF